MKRFFSISMVLFITFSLVAQEKTMVKETGLIFSGLNSYGLTYRTGSTKSVWRFNTLFLSGYSENDISEISEEKQSNTGFGVRIGKESRKNIAKNLEIRFGADVSFRYNQSKFSTNDLTSANQDRLTKKTTFSPGINFVFGLNYIIHGNFLIGAEILPTFSYVTGTSIEMNDWKTSGKEVTGKISGFNYGLSNTSVLLSLLYRIK
jgi:hypothetical protein